MKRITVSCLTDSSDLVTPLTQFEKSNLDLYLNTKVLSLHRSCCSGLICCQMATPPRKKPRKPYGDASNEVENPTELPEMLQNFRVYSEELTAQQDRHERLVKISRDLTVVGKRAIFVMQRVHLNSKESCNKAVSEAREKLREAGGKLLFQMYTELRGMPSELYRRAISPGLQEYTEALALMHFLENGSLASRGTCNAFIWSCLEAQKAAEQSDGTDIDREGLSLCVEDYVLGVADLSGELMRLAINSAGQGNSEATFRICAFVRTFQEELAILESTSHWRGFYQKINTLKSTVRKLEQACYTLRVRGTEVPQHMLGDLFRSSSGPKLDDDAEQ